MGYKQAVVVIHGMGEQRPLDTLYRFVETGLVPDARKRRFFYSRPETVTGSFEERRLLAPAASLEGGGHRVQTEFFEYHWSYKMQGNRFSDLWPLLRRTVLQRPSHVPFGLRGAWWLVWGIAALVGALFALGYVGPFGGEDGVTIKSVVTGLIGTGVVPSLIVTVVKMLPGKITASFVDVVRYLDTSPRSYEARRDIRQGLVEMLQALHEPARGYDRVILVAHSLGGYIAYDGITYLWSTMNRRNAGLAAPYEFEGLDAVEKAASDLRLPTYSRTFAPDDENESQKLEAFRNAQRNAWVGLRNQGNPWLITDLITCGTPMYFADQLLATVSGRTFRKRVEAGEVAVCPPESELAKKNNINKHRLFFSWAAKVRSADGGTPAERTRRVLHEGAPFAVTRWTNLYFPVEAGFFGDWFGGPLRPLFGTGISDIAVRGNLRPAEGTSWLHNRRVPAVAHSFYFTFPEDGTDESVTTAIREALELNAGSWLSRVDPPRRTTSKQAQVPATVKETHRDEPLTAEDVD